MRLRRPVSVPASAYNRHRSSVTSRSSRSRFVSNTRGIVQLALALGAGDAACVTNRRTWPCGALLAVILSLVVACTHRGAPALSPTVSQGVYRDPSGWQARVPSGWHVLPFNIHEGDLSAYGAQFSSVVLPPPTLTSGAPVQTNEGSLPADAVSVEIAVTNTSTPQGSLSPLPLSAKELRQGSCPADSACMDTASFLVGEQTVQITIKTGANARKLYDQTIPALLSSIEQYGVQ